MNIIAEITDKEVLGTDGVSNAAPRYTARAILKNTEGLYAVMYAQKFNLFSLVGGGIENGEDVITALKREVMEETGCSCDIIEELGAVYENRYHADYTQYSYYFAVTTYGKIRDAELTKTEIENKTSVQWHTFDKVVELISKPIHETNQRKFLQARDVSALNFYMNKIKDTNYDT